MVMHALHAAVLHLGQAVGVFEDAVVVRDDNDAAGGVPRDKSAIFFAVGHATQKAGTQVMEDIRGLMRGNPTIGWGLMLGTAAILGMPPFGVFASEFLILTQAMALHPWAAPILLLSLGVAFASVFGKVQPMVFGDSDLKKLPHQPALVPVFVHLALVLMLGLWTPPYLADWYRQAARLIG